MAIMCPNKNSKEYKDLLKEVGPSRVYLEWNLRYNENWKQSPTIVENLKEGVRELFESNPELANIGTPELYSQYLDTIFPDSKVKDILYHGTTSENKFDKFNSELNNFGGYYFTLNQSVASDYGSAGVITAVINSTNPLNVIDTSPDMPNHPKVTYEPFKDNNYDYVSYKTDFEKDRTYHESVVRDAEQIHILGSKQDVESFTNFIKNNNTSKILKDSKDSFLNLDFSELTSKRFDSNGVMVFDYKTSKKYTSDYGAMKAAENIRSVISSTVSEWATSQGFHGWEKAFLKLQNTGSRVLLSYNFPKGLENMLLKRDELEILKNKRFEEIKKTANEVGYSFKILNEIRTDRFYNAYGKVYNQDGLIIDIFKEYEKQGANVENPLKFIDKSLLYTRAREINIYDLIIQIEDAYKFPLATKVESVSNPNVTLGGENTRKVSFTMASKNEDSSKKDNVILEHVYDDSEVPGEIRILETNSSLFDTLKKDSNTGEILSRMNHNDKWFQFAIESAIRHTKNEGAAVLKYPHNEDSFTKEILKYFEKTIPNAITIQEDVHGKRWISLDLTTVSPRLILFSKDLLPPSNTKEVETFEDDLSTEITKSEVKNKKLVTNANGTAFKNVSSVLANILENYKDAITPEFAQLLKNLTRTFNRKDSNVKVISKKQLAEKFPSFKNVAMFYSTDENTIYITEEAFKRMNNQEFIATFVHEMAHSRTAHAVENPITFEERDFAEFINEAFVQYSSLAKYKNRSKSYGFTSVHEFIAEIYSNPEFVSELQEIEGFWEKFKELLRNLFGLTRSLKNNELVSSILLIERVNEFVENNDMTSISVKQEGAFPEMFKTFEEFSEENVLPKNISDGVGDLMQVYMDFEIDPTDDNYYVRKSDGKKFRRVTNIITPEFDSNDPIIKVSQDFGNKIDEFIRDFFAENLQPLDSYDFASQEIMDNFISYLDGLRETFNKRGEFVISENIVLHNDELGIAGTVDLLTIDKDGNVRIYDIKSMRGRNFTSYYGSTKFESTTVFEPSGEKHEDGSFKYKVVKGKTQKSKKQKYQEQLSLYNILLNNTYGINAKEIIIIPFEVEYNANDKELQDFRPQSFVKLEKLENVEDVKIKYDGVERTSALTQGKQYVLGTLDAQLEYYKNEILNSIEKNIQSHIHQYNRLKDTKYEAAKRQIKDKISFFEGQKKEFDKVANIDTLQAIIEYVVMMEANIKNLRESMTKEMSYSKNPTLTIKRYSDFLDAYQINEELFKFLSESVDDTHLTEEDKNNLMSYLSNISGVYNEMKTTFTVFSKRKIREMLSSNIKYMPEVETIWRNKLYREYVETGQTEDRERWVLDQMINKYAEDIKKDLTRKAIELVNSPSYDVSTGTMWLNDAVNNSSKYISIAKTILSEDNNEMIEAFSKEESFIYNKIFMPLVKSKGSSNPKVLYENLLEFNEDTGKYYLKGQFNSTFILKMKSLERAKRKAIRDHGEGSSNARKAEKEYNDYYTKHSKENTVDLTHLTKEEMKALNYFKSVVNYSHRETFGKGTVEIVGKMKLYSLPSISKSDMEHLSTGTYLEAFKDKWKSATTIRPDDVNFRYDTDLGGNILYTVPVRYRGELSKDEQSIDLANIFKLEHANAINFRVKNKSINTLQMLQDVVNDSKYYKVSHGKNTIRSQKKKRNQSLVIEGKDSNTSKNLANMIERHSFDIHHKYAGKFLGMDGNKIINSINGYTAQLGMSLNIFSATANIMNGNAMLFLEGLAGDKLSKRSLAVAEAAYFKDFAKILEDTTKSIPTSKVNLILRYFDTMGFSEGKLKDFINEGLLKSHAGTGFMMAMQESGEHWIQAIGTMAVLEEIKVFNASQEYIDKDGNVVQTEAEAASLLDMIEIDEKGNLDFNKNFVYTTHTMTTPFFEGGKTQVNLLIEKKILDMFGNYKPTTQPEAMRHWWGKLLMLFRRFFISMGTRRYRGFSNSLKSLEELESDPDRFRNYSYALKEYEEGVYTSVVRFITHGLLPAIKQWNFSVAKNEYDKLSKHQKGNLKFASSEVAFASIIIPILKVVVIASFGDDDDSRAKYFALYQLRRLETELEQFRNLSETVKMVRSPFASVRTAETVSSAIFKTFYFPEWGERYKSGNNKGELKIIKNYEKLIPGYNQRFKDAKVLYNYQDTSFGGF